MPAKFKFDQLVEIHFEGDSLEVLSSFPGEIKRTLGFSLRQLQLGKEPACQTRSMSSIGRGVYELKEADERAWYRCIYLLQGRDLNWFGGELRSIRQMKSAAENKPTHIVAGNVFDALGFSAAEASALKIKAEILSAILEHVRQEGYTQAQLVKLLGEHQPSVSNLLSGRISQVSIEKLLRYADRLKLETSIAVRPMEMRARRKLSDVGTSTRRARKLA